jgi:hypothetical protein
MATLDDWLSLKDRRLGKGFFGSVYALEGSADKVLKIAANDATRDYIEFCHKLTISGLINDAQCVNMVRVYDCGDSGDGTWWAVMERCAATFSEVYRNPERYPGATHVDRADCYDAIDIMPALIAMLNATFPAPCGRFCNDAHRGNFMWSTARKCWVLTDPASGTYSGSSEAALKLSGLTRSN